MSGRGRAPVWVLAVLCAAGIAVTVWALASGREVGLGIGLPVAVLAGILIPVMVRRAKKQNRLLEGRDVLAQWEYGLDEARAIAGLFKKQSVKAGVGLAILGSFCLAIIFLCFIGPLLKEFDRLPVPFVAGAVVTLALIWAAVPLSASLRARAVMAQPCRTVIGLDCLVVCNRWHPLNDYSRLKAEGAKLVRKQGEPAVLRMRYSYVAGKRLSKYRKEVDVPVPAGSEQAAQRIVELFYLK